MLSDSSQGSSQPPGPRAESKFPSQCLTALLNILAVTEFVKQVEKPVFGIFNGPFLDFMGLSSNPCARGSLGHTRLF